MIDIEALIKRWQAGDERAAEVLYNHHQAQIFRLAYAILGDETEAEEATQDALIYALTKINRYNPRRASFRTWLYQITVSRCRDRLRRRRPFLSLSRWLERGGDMPDPVPNQERQVIRTETFSQVWWAVQALKPSLREAILLRYWAGHTYREMAEILDCPISTAQSRVRLASQRLEDALNPDALGSVSEFGEEKLL